MSTRFLLLVLAVSLYAFPAFVPGADVAGAQTVTPATYDTVSDGDLIRQEGDYKVFVVKHSGEQKFKRWIVTPEVFAAYPHLDRQDGKIIDEILASEYQESRLVKLDGSPAVWFIPDPALGARPEKFLIPNEVVFVAAGFDWDAIFIINSSESSLYRDAGVYQLPLPNEGLLPTPPPIIDAIPAPSPTVSPSSSPTASPTVSPSPSPSNGPIRIIYRSTGFETSDVTVSKGTTVRFENGSSQTLWLASNPHPTHADLPSLNTGGIAPNKSFTYIFSSTGDWGFHNHQQPQFGGIVHVR